MTDITGQTIENILTDQGSSGYPEPTDLTIISREVLGSPVNYAMTIEQLLNYNQGSVGADNQLITNKLKSYVSVKDFGATGDGVTNDTPAIQAAIDSGSGGIYFPTPTISYSCGTLVLRNGVTLFGDGPSSMIRQTIAPMTSQGLLFANSGAANVQIPNITIFNLQIKGLVSTLGFSEFNYLISFHGVKNLLIKDCLLTGFRGDAIVIASGDIAGTERHNNSVKILNNYIDGENNDNRNGISIIDCTDLLIDGNTFINCTRSNMPGAIDFEPNSFGNSVVNNCRVTNNNFSNIGGNVAAIAFDFGGVVLTTQPGNFIVTGNTFTVGVPPIFCRANPGNPGLINLIFSENSGTCGRPLSFLGYVNGVTYESNRFSFGATGLIGFSSTDQAKNINFINNTLLNINGSLIVGLSALSLTNANINGNNISNCSICIDLGSEVTSGGVISNCNLVNNNFNNSTTGVKVGAYSALTTGINILDNDFNVLVNGVLLGEALSTLSQINVNNNLFSSLSNSIQFGNINITSLTNVQALNNNFKSVTRKSITSTPSAIDFSTITWFNNRGDGTVNSQIWVTDDCGTVVNGNTAVSFNSTTLPDSFPVGTSISVINGDSGVPNGGGSNQGILTTYRYTNTVGYERYTYQTFYAASNTLKNGAFWTRKRASTTNTWLAWFEHTGV